MTTLRYVLLFPGIAALTFAGCKKNHTPSLPEISTANVINITATTASGGGVIQPGSESSVINSGLCWSSTRQSPDVTDDTTEGAAASGAFTAVMTKLNPGTVYYVRAYVTGNAGTAYGNLVSFTTTAIVSNRAPEARNIAITGDKKAGKTLTVHYTYFDTENDPENGTGFQWYIANDTTGGTMTRIPNATGLSYTLSTADQNKFLVVSVTPKAATGSSPGVETPSQWIGPIGPPDPSYITFTYNGQNVTYGIITSTLTGRQWLDRNLGAPNAPGSYNDWQNTGDLFQWGRKPDGHQLIIRAASSAATTAVNGTTTTVSSSDDPGNSLFITTAASPFDWHIPQNEHLWETSGGTNNACPSGWHIPSRTEWEAEQLGNLQDAYNKLKITVGGGRNINDGLFSLTTIAGIYWSSTTFIGVFNVAYTYDFSASGNAISSTTYPNAYGFSVRCIKN